MSKYPNLSKLSFNFNNICTTILYFKNALFNVHCTLKLTECTKITLLGDKLLSVIARWQVIFFIIYLNLPSMTLYAYKLELIWCIHTCSEYRKLDWSAMPDIALSYLLRSYAGDVHLQFSSYVFLILCQPTPPVYLSFIAASAILFGV